MALALVASSTLLSGQCITDVRDALVGGALDFVAGTTTSLFDAWFPLSTWFAPTVEIPEPEEA